MSGIARTLVLAICLLTFVWASAHPLSSRSSPGPRPEAAAGSPPVSGLLRLEKALHLRHGNAATMRWHEDGRRLFLANEEGNQGLTVIDATDPRNPRWLAGAMPGGMNYVWFVSVREGAVAARSSIGGGVAFGSADDISRMRAVDPPRGTTEARIVETDGRYVFAPYGGKPGRIQSFDARSGKVVAQIEEADGFEGLWGSHYDHGRRLLAIGSQHKPASGIPGGLYLYRVNANGTLTRLGKYAGVSVGALEVNGDRAFVEVEGRILILDIHTPSAPTRLGTYQHRQNHSINWMSASRDGRRLYITGQKPSPNPSADDRPVWEAAILDATNPSTLRLLGSRDWGRFEPFRPMAIAKHPTKPLVAVSHWDFGVSFHDVAGDQFTELGLINTAGEIRDVYITPSGRTGWAFAWTAVVQKFDLERGVHSGFVRDYGSGGGWTAYRGFVLDPTPGGANVIKADDTAFRVVAFLRTPMGGQPLKLAVEEGTPPHVFAATDNEVVIVRLTRFDPLGAGVATEEVSRFRPQGMTSEMCCIKGIARGGGDALYVLSDQVGLLTYNVRDKSTPVLASRDQFTFEYNWEYQMAHSPATKRLALAAGSKGVRVYDTRDSLRPVLVGQITGVSATWVSIFKDKYLLVSNYWRPKAPEGLIVYDLRTLRQLDRWPRDRGDPGFRFRVFGERIYRLPLWGVEVLGLP